MDSEKDGQLKIQFIHSRGNAYREITDLIVI